MQPLGRRRLGRSGLTVSGIGLGGAWLLGDGGALPLERAAAFERCGEDDRQRILVLVGQMSRS